MDHTEERKEPPPSVLLPETEDYLRNTAGLPYPKALVGQFPRIVNQLVAVRAEPDKLKALFEELTHDHRGGRHGFTFDVLMDIHALSEAMLGTPPSFELNDENKWVS